MMYKKSYLFSLSLFLFSFCAMSQMFASEYNFASTDLLKDLLKSGCGKNDQISNTRGFDDLSALSPEEKIKIDQKKQQIIVLLEQSIEQLYSVKSGYAFFCGAALSAILAMVGIYTYEPKKRIYVATGFDLKRGNPIAYYHEEKNLSDAERQALIKNNRMMCLLVGGLFTISFALVAYYLMYYHNEVLDVTRQYEGHPEIFTLEIEEYRAFNKWFDNLVTNLKINDLLLYLPLVDKELDQALWVALNNPNNFRSKCEFALHVCSLLKSFEKTKTESEKSI